MPYLLVSNLPYCNISLILLNLNFCVECSAASGGYWSGLRSGPALYWLYSWLNASEEPPSWSLENQTIYIYIYMDPFALPTRKNVLCWELDACLYLRQGRCCAQEPLSAGACPIRGSCARASRRSAIWSWPGTLFPETSPDRNEGSARIFNVVCRDVSCFFVVLGHVWLFRWILMILCFA